LATHTDHNRRGGQEERAPPPMWLPPAATTPPPFVRSTRACEIAAQFYEENTSGWRLHESTYAMSEGECYRALQNHARRISEIPTQHRTELDNDLAGKWNSLLNIREQVERAQEYKIEQELLYQEVKVKHQEVQKQMEMMQQQRLELAIKELKKIQRLVERYKEVLELREEY
jgi:hypothetical protein